MIDLIGKLGDPKAVATAIQPILDGLESKAAAAVKALPQDIVDALDGMTITITIQKKKP